MREKAASGLEVPSLVLGEHSDRGGIADADPAVAAGAPRRRRARDRLGRGAAAPARSSSRSSDASELHDEATSSAPRDAFRALCRAAADAGVVLCYEGTLPADGDPGARRARGARERSAATSTSPTSSCAGMDSATEIRALGPLIRRVHFKDARVTVGDCPPGLGSVDFAESARALDEIGYDDWVVLETPPAPPELVARDLVVRTIGAAAARAAGVAAARHLHVRLRPRRMGARRSRRASASGSRRCSSAGALLDECLEQPEDDRSVVARLDDAGISIVALAGYRNLVAPDDADQARGSRLPRALPRAGAAPRDVGRRDRDRDAVTRGGLEDSPENMRPEARALLDESLARAGPRAERAGADPRARGHVKNVLRTPVQLLGLLERFPSPHLQVVLDPYNYVSHHLLPAHERLTRAFLDRFEHRFVLAHLKDVDPAGADVGTIEFGPGVFAQERTSTSSRTRRPGSAAHPRAPAARARARGDQARARYSSSTLSVVSGSRSIRS